MTPTPANPDREILSTRVVAATPELIVQAFREADRLAHWWGPEGFTNTFHEFDFQEGGHWRFDMHGPDGTDYANHNVFQEIGPERLVVHHLGSVHAFLLTVTLRPECEGTRIDWSMVFESAEECERVKAYVPRCNEENFDRLEAELGRMQGERELSLSRLIDAPREAVYQAWTDPELLKQWFAPLPYLTPVAELDVRPGGTSHIVMRGPDGVDLPNRGVYLEVVPNERLVVTDAFSEAWVPSAKPFITIVLTFDREEGKTRYTARVLHWTVADRESHEKMGFHEGWGRCTDQLAAMVERREDGRRKTEDERPKTEDGKKIVD